MERARKRRAISVGSALLHGAEETQIAAARLYDNNVGSIRHIPIDAVEHHPRGVKRHSGIGDLGVDPRLGAGSATVRDTPLHCRRISRAYCWRRSPRFVA